jgi:DNA-binding transcriptional LysR family regulator
LRSREHDVIIARVARPLVGEGDIDIETLFQDQLLIAAHMCSTWARRRKIDPAELVDAPWILTAPGTSVYLSVAEAFRGRGLTMPKISVGAQSGQARMSLLATGPFITAVPRSLLLFNATRYSLKVLPADLDIQGYPVAILTPKNRLLSPLIGLFLDHVRSVAASVARTAPSG